MSDVVQRQFDRAAAAYGASPIFAAGHDLALMVEATQPTAAMSVLDVGTAAGHTAFAFASHVHEVVGTDVSAGMLTEATRQAAARSLTNVRFEAADLAALPFPDAAFDIVTCRFVVHHLPALAPMLRDIARVLKPGGQFVVVDTVSPEDASLAGFLNAVERLRDPSHGRDWSLSEWQAAGEKIGVPFTVVTQWLLSLDFADWTARQQTPPDAIAALERLFDTATTAAHQQFHIVGPPTRAFRLPCALLRGVKVA